MILYRPMAYAQSHHIYVPSSVTPQVQTHISKCLLGVSTWMSRKHLKLKGVQTEILFSTPCPNLVSSSQPSQLHFLRPSTMRSLIPPFLIHPMFNLFTNLDISTLKIYLISNYLHYHFCLWTIYYQPVVIWKYTPNYFTYEKPSSGVSSLSDYSLKYNWSTRALHGWLLTWTLASPPSVSSLALLQPHLSAPHCSCFVPSRHDTQHHLNKGICVCSFWYL